jgi:hypothetical protein
MNGPPRAEAQCRTCRTQPLAPTLVIEFWSEECATATSHCVLQATHTCDAASRAGRQTSASAKQGGSGLTRRAAEAPISSPAICWSACIVQLQAASLSVFIKHSVFWKLDLTRAHNNNTSTMGVRGSVLSALPLLLLPAAFLACCDTTIASSDTSAPSDLASGCSTDLDCSLNGECVMPRLAGART